MDSQELRDLQSPLKEHYREAPKAAEITLSAHGALDGNGVSCSVETGRAMIEAGLHPSTGGTGLQACSGDMLLQALVACAGVTLRAVSTALEIPVSAGTVRAEGILDVRGTLGVARDAPVGFKEISLSFDLVTDAEPEMLDKLISVTERYCVVYQTLLQAPDIAVTRQTHMTAAGRAAIS